MALRVFAGDKTMRPVRAHRRVSPRAGVLGSPAGFADIVETLLVRGLCSARDLTRDRRPGRHGSRQIGPNGGSGGGLRLRRETELLQHLAGGADTREVARLMFVSENTVQDHLKSIFDKSTARSRRTLLARALGT
jgi:DNA-binding NarL/FixJ family response regulator